MTIENSHGKARPTLPRASDLPDELTARDRSAGRDAQGRFLAGNDTATGRGWKQLIAKQAGRDLAGEAGELAHEAWQLYTAFLRELPYDCASVRQLVASRARAATMSARYAFRAAEVGLDTDAGAAAMEMSVKLDQRAERLAVTSFDLSSKLAVSGGKRKVIDLGAVMAEASKPRERP